MSSFTTFPLALSNHLSLTPSCHSGPGINVSSCASLWTWLSETIAGNSCLAWPMPLSLCGWPQASSRAAVLPPPHAEQTQTTAASLLTWHPARSRHARGICTAHACKYGTTLIHTFTFRHTCVMIYRRRYSGQSGQDPKVGIIHGWQKKLPYSCGWINQKCQTPYGCDSLYFRLWTICADALSCHSRTVIFVSTFFPFPQMEKQMSCVMGIPGPVHNPSCSSSQVLTSIDIVFLFL